jgi:hypothetical protein
VHVLWEGADYVDRVTADQMANGFQLVIGTPGGPYSPRPAGFRPNVAAVLVGRFPVPTN